MVASARPLEAFLQRPGRKGIHVGVLQAQIAPIAGRPKLNRDQVARMFPRTRGYLALRTRIPVRHNCSRDAEFSGSPHIAVFIAAPLAKCELSADVP